MEIVRGLPAGYLGEPYPRSGGLAVGADGTVYVTADCENAVYRITRTAPLQGTGQRGSDFWTPAWSAADQGHQAGIGPRDPTRLGDLAEVIGCTAGTADEAAVFGKAVAATIPSGAIDSLSARSDRQTDRDRRDEPLPRAGALNTARHCTWQGSSGP